MITSGKAGAALARRNAGFGLIEVLITIIVIGVGLVGIAKLQGILISESRVNKERAEAQSYCKDSIEQLRTAISRAEFQALPETLTPTAQTINGTLSSFSRTVKVENLPTPGTTLDADAVEKRITATCTWGDEEVVLQTTVGIHNAANSAIASGAAASSVISPSLRAGSSEDLTELIPLEVGDPGYNSPGSVVQIDDVYYVVLDTGTSAATSVVCSQMQPAVLPFENDLRARRVDEDGYPGQEGIELFDVVTVDDVAYCVPLVRYNGGVIVPIRGVVHSRIQTNPNSDYLPVDLFTLNVSESGTYCIFEPDEGETSAPYSCYVGGNCAYGPDGSDDTDFTQCPAERPENILVNVGEGGWRGKIGLLQVAANDLNVCFAEEASGTVDSTRDTARNYYTRSAGPNSSVTSDDRNQGINKPYACHDFLIIEGINNPNHVALRNECVAQALTVGGLNLASKNIQRDVAVGSYNNIYDPIEGTSFCSDQQNGTDYVISGSLVNPSGGVVVKVSDGATTILCDVVDTSYTCSFTTSAQSVQIWGEQGGVEYPDGRCSDDLSDSTGCTITFPNESTWTIRGYFTGTLADITSGLNAITLAVGSSETSCGLVSGGYDSASSSWLYECAFVKPDAVNEVSLVVSINNGYEVSPNNTLIDLSGANSSDVITGPNMAVSQIQPVTISGSITLGGGVSQGQNGFSVAVAVQGGISCSVTPPSNGWGQNRTGSYSCEVASGWSGVLNFTVSPICSKGTGKSSGFKYELTADATSEDDGSLALNVGTTNSNRTINLAITKTSTGCAG